MDWTEVEVRGKTIEMAVEAALAELGLGSEDEADIEVLEEPSRGVLGFGGKDALVRVKAKPKRPPRRRRRSRGKGQQDKPDAGGEAGSKPRARQPSRGGGEGRRQERQGGGGREGGRQHKGGGAGRGGRQRPEAGRERKDSRKRSEGEVARMGQQENAVEEVDLESQASVVAEFLEGLLDAFGLEGTVATRVEEEIILAEVTGEQTEALVGHKGAILQSVGELVRTVVQRRTFRRARLRLDVGGYMERRREALRIYATRLADRVLAEGGELMLEPMNPADRKVVHDSVLEIEGVRSFSEGEEPNRSVVIALAPGVEPKANGNSSSVGEAEDDEAAADDGGEDLEDD